MASTKALFSPLKLGSITVRNRIFLSAMTRDRALGSVPTEVMIEYYRQRAAAGAGLLVTEGVLVSRQGTEWPNAPGIWNQEQITGWKKITDAVHAAGSHIYAQLWHVGRVAHPDAEEQKAAGIPVYAPSAISARGGKFRYIPGVPGYVTPTAVEDPWTLVALFKEAAKNAKAAGFDGVEIHGANGYIISQFLDSNSNKRTDQWGGSAENRSRFGLEVIKATKEVFGENVAIKVTPGGGYNDVGMPLEETLETFQYFLAEVDKLKPSYVTLARYSAALDPGFDGKPRGTPHDVVESYRFLLKNTKVVVNAGVSPEEGASLIADGKADAIAIGFAFIAHPDLVKRVEHNKPLDTPPKIPNLYWNPNGEFEASVGYTDYPEATY